MTSPNALSDPDLGSFAEAAQSIGIVWNCVDLCSKEETTPFKDEATRAVVLLCSELRGEETRIFMCVSDLDSIILWHSFCEEELGEKLAGSDLKGWATLFTRLATCVRSLPHRVKIRWPGKLACPFADCDNTFEAFVQRANHMTFSHAECGLYPTLKTVSIALVISGLCFDLSAPQLPSTIGPTLLNLRQFLATVKQSAPCETLTSAFLSSLLPPGAVL